MCVCVCFCVCEYVCVYLCVSLFVCVWIWGVSLRKCVLVFVSSGENHVTPCFSGPSWVVVVTLESSVREIVSVCGYGSDGEFVCVCVGAR